MNFIVTAHVIELFYRADDQASDLVAVVPVQVLQRVRDAVALQLEPITSREGLPPATPK